MPAQDVLDDLINVLRTKGVLANEDIEHLRRLRHNARHVANIDGWALAP